MTTAPFVPSEPDRTVTQVGAAAITHLVTCPYYSVYHGVLDGKAEMDFTAPFVNLSILDGAGTLDGEPVKKGDHMVLTANYGRAVLEGKMEFIYSPI